MAYISTTNVGNGNVGVLFLELMMRINDAWLDYFTSTRIICSSF